MAATFEVARPPSVEESRVQAAHDTRARRVPAQIGRVQVEPKTHVGETELAQEGREAQASG